MLTIIAAMAERRFVVRGDEKLIAFVELQMVLVRDVTHISQDASATNNQIISWAYHSPFSRFSYLPPSRTGISRPMPTRNAD